MITTKQLTVPKIKKYLVNKLGRQTLKYLDIHVKDASTNNRTFLIRTKPKLLNHPFCLWIFNLFGEEGNGPCVPCGQMYMNGSSFGRQHTVSTIYTFHSKLLSDIRALNGIITNIIDRDTLIYKSDQDVMNEHNYYIVNRHKHISIYYKKLAIATSAQLYKVLSLNNVHLYKIGKCFGRTQVDLIKKAEVYKYAIRLITNILYDIHYDNNKRVYTGLCGVYYCGKKLDIQSLVQMHI